MEDRDQERIDFILDAFNFEKVHKAMEAIGWQWWSASGVPDIATLRKRARYLLKEALLRKAQVGTGGFEADAREDELLLRFVIEQKDDIYFEDLKE